MNLTEFIQKHKDILLGILAVAIIVVIVAPINGNVKEKRAIETACAEVKSQVLYEYGETPSVKGSVLYENGNAYVVLVKFRTEFGDGSIVCYVYGNKQRYIRDTLKEMPYDYEYDVDEIKTLWKIE